MFSIGKIKQILAIILAVFLTQNLFAEGGEGNLLSYIRQEKTAILRAIARRTDEIISETRGTSRIWSAHFMHRFTTDATLLKHRSDLKRIEFFAEFLEDNSKWRRQTVKTHGFFEHHVNEKFRIINDYRNRLPKLDCNNLQYIDSMIYFANNCENCTHKFPRNMEDFFSEDFFSFCEMTKEQLGFLTEIPL